MIRTKGFDETVFYYKKFNVYQKKQSSKFKDRGMEGMNIEVGDSVEYVCYVNKKRYAGRVKKEDAPALIEKIRNSMSQGKRAWRFEIV